MNYKKTLSLIAILALFTACGGGGGGGSASGSVSTPSIKPKPPTSAPAILSNITKDAKKTAYSNIPALPNAKSEDITFGNSIDSSKKSEVTSTFNNLFNSAFLKFSPREENSGVRTSQITLNGVGFDNGWNQGFSGNGIIIGVNDNGTDDLSKLAVNKHYTYKNTIEGWNTLKNRLDSNNFIEHTYKENYLQSKDFLFHGKKVMQTANLIAKDLKFANIVNPIGEEAGEAINMAATIDALSNAGIRFFNQSFAYDRATATSPNPGNFYTAIMNANALVFSAAGNFTDSASLNPDHFTSHALPSDSPLRKGWVIVLGYSTSAPSASTTKHFYINDDGTQKEVYHYGNTCKKKGWDDCISAPYTINGNLGTSFSTPIATSVAVLIYEKYPWMSNDNIKETLFTTAFKVTGSSGVTDDDIKANFGVGILNPKKAMNGVAEFRHDFNANVNMNNLYDFSNNISGSGAIIKDGTGTLVLSGNNTFNGASVINAGTLWLRGQNTASFTNNANGILRLSSATAGSITNNGTLINEGASLSSLSLGNTSKIYANLGDTLNVSGAANLAGEYNLVGVKKGSSFKQNDTVELLSATSLSGTFKSVQSLVAFLDISAPTYASNKVNVTISKIDLANVKDLNDYAKANYQSLFTQLDNYLAYETANKDNTEYTSSYKPDILNGNLTKATFASEVSDFYDSILNTPKSDLAKTTKRLFGDDFYTNSLLEISKIKNINANELKNGFNAEQSFKYNKINDLKESASQTLISNVLSKDDYKIGLGFIYNQSNIYNDDFKNKAKSFALKAEFSYLLDSLLISNNLSLVNTVNKTQRFMNEAKFHSTSLAYGLKLAYDLGELSPYASLNAIYLRQGAFAEAGDKFSLGLDKFSKFFAYANAGLKYQKNLDNLAFKASVDFEYNFYKNYKMSAQNLKYAGNIDTNNGFNKKWLTNIKLGLDYAINSKFNLAFDYKANIAKKYLTNECMLGLNYNF